MHVYSVITENQLFKRICIPTCAFISSNTVGVHCDEIYCDGKNCNEPHQSNKASEVFGKPSFETSAQQYHVN